MNKTNFDVDIYKLITRGNSDNYSPNNIKSIEVAPGSVTCHYHINDKGGSKALLENYATVSTQEDYYSVFSSFNTTKHNGESHKCQNIEEITINLINNKNGKFLSPYDIFVWDLLIGSTEGGKITSAEMQQIKVKKETFIKEVNAIISMGRQQKVNPTNILSTLAAQRKLDNWVKSLYSDKALLSILHKGFPRLCKLNINLVNGKGAYSFYTDDSYLKEIGLNGNKYLPDKVLTKEEQLTVKGLEQYKDKEEREIYQKYRPLGRHLYLLKLQYERGLVNCSEETKKEEFDNQRQSQLKSAQTTIKNLETAYNKAVNMMNQTIFAERITPVIVYNHDSNLKYNKQMENLGIIRVENVGSDKEAIQRTILAYTTAINDLYDKVNDGLIGFAQSDNATDKIVIDSLTKKYKRDVVRKLDPNKVTLEDINAFLGYMSTVTKLYFLYTADIEYDFRKFSEIAAPKKKVVEG